MIMSSTPLSIKTSKTVGNMTVYEDVYIKFLTETAKVPTYSSELAAGADLYADEDVVLACGERKLIKTGISLELPAYFQAHVCSRSGLALKNGICVLNAPGIIDADYRGEIGVVVYNTTVESFTVKKGDRIAQLVLLPVYRMKLIEVDELDETERGHGGFGSSGR